MATLTYKCPNCGAPIQFKPGEDQLECEYCLSHFGMETLEEYTQKELKKQQKETTEEASEDREKFEVERDQEIEDHLMHYHCDSCGAEVVTDDTTSSTFCYYCHNPVLLTERLQGDFRPDKIIPFRIDRKKAEERFLEWAKKHSYVPSSFYSSSQLEKITGMYLPYWMADSQVDMDIYGTGNVVRKSVMGSRETTTVQEYLIERKGTVDIDNIGELALKKINKELIESILPYDEKKMNDFSMGYLSGFFAETYDISKEEVAPDIEKRMKEYTNQLVERQLSSFSDTKLERRHVEPKIANWYYTLLPAWVLTYIYDGKTYVYALNGQTGAAYGELPLDKKKLTLHSVLVAVVIFIIVSLVGWFI